MKIKRLELNGFKSFQEKTVIPFPKGISGVVGPNGCGKSNIVDAIKWVMGEQSPKQLRGKGMEDVIFAGSNGRSSLGMAEVSLVLDNDNGSMPPEYNGFNEIMVTRRLFRDGESEYAINKRPCRLKDITHLFMDTGVGSKAYAVIEQGRVGAIIDSKPEDRRHWVEEAAGISKYRSKKNESLRKLDLTQQNLLRVGDVIAEVRRQMNSLYRQAKKAERFKEIRKQSKEVELVLLAREYQELEQEKVLKDRHLLDQEGRVEEAKALYQALEENGQVLQAQLLDLERELKEQQEQYYLQKTEWQRQEDLVQNYAKEIGNLEREDLEHQRESREIENWLLDKNSEEKSLEEEVASFSERFSKEQERVREQEQAVAQAKEAISRTAGSHEKLKDLLVTKLTELTKVRNQRSGLVKVREDRNRRTLRQAEEKAQLQDRLNQLRTSSRETETASSEVRQSLQQLGESLSRIQQEKFQKKELRKGLADELRLLEQTLQQDLAQIKNLQEIRDNYQSYQTGVRTLLQEKWSPGSGPSPEFFMVLAEGIETEPGYELAVEAALGEALQAILIKNPEKALEGIRYLKETNRGKAGFIPLGLGQRPGKQVFPGEEKGLEPLLSKVSAGEDIQEGLQAILGNYFLAADLTQALKIWENFPGEFSLVTREGDVIDQRGLIAGGSLGSLESGILYQKNVIRRLENKVQEQQGKVASKKEELAELETVLQDLTLQGQALEEEKAGVEKRLFEFEKRVFGYQEQAKPLEKRYQLLGIEEDEVRSLEADDASEERTLAVEEERLNQSIHQVKGEIQGFEATLKGLEEALEQKREAFTQYQTFLSALKEKGEHIGKEWQRLREALEEKRTRQSKILEKITRAEEIKSGLKENLQTGQGHVQGLGEKVSRLEEYLKEINLKWEDLVARKEELEGALRESRGEVAEAETVENELRLENSRRVLKIDHLKEQALERSGLSIADIVETHGQREEDFESLKQKRQEFKEKLEQIGEVNLTAIEEYNAFKERHDFYKSQEEDLLKSIDSLKRAIHKINSTSKDLFLGTFKAVQEKMEEVFPILFAGGSAKLSLTDEDDPLESGVEIMVHPPGKRLTNMSLLSGGEKALTALALLFSIYLVKPSPFCLLDEIDAFLDEANVERFKGLVHGIVKDSQIILITHNRRVMEMADTLFGVTMEQPGISKLVSVQLATIQ